MQVIIALWIMLSLRPGSHERRSRYLDRHILHPGRLYTYLHRAIKVDMKKDKQRGAHQKCWL